MTGSARWNSWPTMTPKAECLPKTSSAICLATSSTALMPKSAVLRTLVDFPSVPGKRQFSPEFPPVTLVTCRRSHVCHPWRTAVEPKLRYFRKASAEAYCGRGRVLIPPLRQMHLPEVERAETETSAHNVLTNPQPTIRPISILSPFGKHWDTIGPVRKGKEGKSGVTMWGLLVPAG